MLAFVLVSGSLWIILGEFRYIFLYSFLRCSIAVMGFIRSDAPASQGLRRIVCHPLPAFSIHSGLWYFSFFAEHTSSTVQSFRCRFAAQKDADGDIFSDYTCINPSYIDKKV